MCQNGTRTKHTSGHEKRNGCSSTSVKDNLTWCGSLFPHKACPGHSLPTPGTRATDSVTINAAVLLVLAFAALTNKSRALVLTASEERGEAHFGEPCSWCPTSKVKHLAKPSATKGAFYTCELARRWCQGNADKPGSLGVLTNFPCSGAVKTGWPKYNAKKLYLGPLSSTCQMQIPAQGLHLSKATSKSTHAATCVEFLHTLPRRWCLNMIKEWQPWLPLFTSDRRRQSSKVPVEGSHSGSRRCSRGSGRRRQSRSRRWWSRTERALVQGA